MLEHGKVKRERTIEAKIKMISEFVGKRFIHSGNGFTYLVTDIIWDCRDDQWALVHAQVVPDNPDRSILYTRPYDNFFGCRCENGKFVNRFCEVS